MARARAGGPLLWSGDCPCAQVDKGVTVGLTKNPLLKPPMAPRAQQSPSARRCAPTATMQGRQSARQKAPPARLGANNGQMTLRFGEIQGSWLGCKYCSRWHALSDFSSRQQAAPLEVRYCMRWSSSTMLYVPVELGFHRGAWHLSVDPQDYSW